LNMSEKMLFFNVQKDLIYSDYFELTLNDGRVFQWKNFGQSITVDGADLRKTYVSVAGAVMQKEVFSNIEGLEDYQWLVDAYEFGYGEEPNSIVFKLPADEIVIFLNQEYVSRNESYPEMDYFDWLNDYKKFNKFKEMMNLDESKAIDYLNKWRRPKLKTNGIIKAVVMHNSSEIYVGIYAGEKKKSVVDAFFRMAYKLQFEAK